VWPLRVCDGGAAPVLFVLDRFWSIPFVAALDGPGAGKMRADATVGGLGAVS
jgi:hypothetical protein